MSTVANYNQRRRRSGHGAVRWPSGGPAGGDSCAVVGGFASGAVSSAGRGPGSAVGVSATRNGTLCWGAMTTVAIGPPCAPAAGGVVVGDGRFALAVVGKRAGGAVTMDEIACGREGSGDRCWTWTGGTAHHTAANAAAAAMTAVAAAR